MLERGATVYGLLRHLRPIVLDSVRVVERLVHDLGWTVGSRAVVEALAERGSATVPQVAAELSLARQNVQRQVDELLRLGHVRTRPNPAHRRSVLLQLTPAGRKAFDRLHSSELTDLASLAGECTDEELAVAERVLAALERDIRVRAASEGRDARERHGERRDLRPNHLQPAGDR